MKKFWVMVLLAVGIWGGCHAWETSVNEKNIKISVVVPVYNTQPYLRRCLDSIVNQTLKEMEIICVNDASTDGSLDILREYADKDDRVVVVNLKKNKGPGVARNEGLKVAKGEWVGFVDSDDFIDRKWFENLYQQRDAYDMIMGVFLINGEMMPRAKHSFLYGNIVRRQFLTDKNIKFPPTRYAEDKVFWNRIKAAGAKFRFLKDQHIYYHYEKRENTLMKWQAEQMVCKKGNVLKYVE